MEVTLHQLGKKYIRSWIFRGLDYHINSGDCLAITGPNGSGKSTLLKILSGGVVPTEGEIKYIVQHEKIDQDNLHSYTSFAAPYSELVEEFYIDELVRFYNRFKSFQKGIGIAEWNEAMQFQFPKDRPFKYFSSGMKQRVKLGLAVLSETPLLLLDEPTSNLDDQGKEWYLELMKTFLNGRTCIIASNEPREYEFCSSILKISNYI